MQVSEINIILNTHNYQSYLVIIAALFSIVKSQSRYYIYATNNPLSEGIYETGVVSKSV